MNIVMPNFALATVEMFVLSMACLILVVDLYLSEKNRIITYLLTQVTLVIAIVLSLNHAEGVTFSGHFVRDAMGDWLKVFIYGITAVVFLYSRDYLKDRGINKGEYYVLGLFAVLGMMIMVSAHSFLTVYLGLELLSLSLYAMVAFQRDNGVASEAAMKYFVLGAIASGMLLYGMSMIYGISHTLDIAGVSKYIAGQKDMDMVLSFGLVFVVIGLAFKLGAVPFHMWVPDVYHGAPTSVTLFLGTAPKLAAFAMAMRLLAESMQGLNADWQQMLMVMAVLSLAIGNIIAIAQTNMKRMLAYSTISHVGFIMLGILVGTSQGYSAAMFYTITYAIMALGAFGMIIILSRKGFESDELADFKGLSRRSPWLAFIMLLLMFSMAGVPPTVGFYSKFMILEAVVNSGMTWLAIVAVLFSVIGAFYYLRVIKLMYFDEPEQTNAIVCSVDSRLMVSTNGIIVLLLGIFPGILMTLCQTVIK